MVWSWGAWAVGVLCPGVPMGIGLMLGVSYWVYRLRKNGERVELGERYPGTNVPDRDWYG